MAGNPILTYLPLNGTLAGTDRNGAFTATGSGALRWQPAEGARVNYVTNPRYAHGTWNYGWGTGGTTTATEETTIAPSGSTKSAKLVTSSGGEGYYSFTKPINTRDASERTLSVLVYKDGTAVTSSDCNIYHNNVLASSPTYESVGGGWYRVWDTFAATAANPNSGIRIEPSKTLYVSNWVLEDGNTTGDYFDGSSAGASWFNPITGQLGTAHASPSCEQLTAWVEEGTTNLCTNPSAEVDLSGVQQVGIGTTLTRDTTTAFLGSACVKVVADGTTSSYQGLLFITNAITAGIGTVFTGSVYVKLPAGEQFRVLVREGSGLQSYTQAIFIATGAWQRVSASHTLVEANPASLQVRVDGWKGGAGFLAYTGYADCAQIEQKSYATSYTDGSLGTGYSWAGTAHASASTRSSCSITTPQTGRIYTVSGSAFVKHKMPDNNAQVVLWTMGGWGTHDYLDQQVSYQAGNKVLLESRVASNPTRLVACATSLPSNIWESSYTAWNVSTMYATHGSEALASASRVETPTNNISGGNLSFAGNFNANGWLNGSIGPVAIYDAPLSDARRALVNTAIDNYDDLWSLFEEWDTQLQPVDLLALQSGQATAGVTAEAQPVDLLALQSGQATAGVTAELAVLELDMMGEEALAISVTAGSQVIPAGRVP